MKKLSLILSILIQTYAIADPIYTCVTEDDGQTLSFRNYNELIHFQKFRPCYESGEQAKKNIQTYKTEQEYLRLQREKELQDIEQKRIRLEEQEKQRNKLFDEVRGSLASDYKKIEKNESSAVKKNINGKINLQIKITEPDNEGFFSISIQTNIDTASLKINGEEFGGSPDGSYEIKKMARAGQETKLKIIATDTNGNSDIKNLVVNRKITAPIALKYEELNPDLIKIRSKKDAVAIIIGIANYQSLPKADFADDDARLFYDYALRGLGIDKDNIRLLIDSDAGYAEILKTFKTWLPPRVKATTDVYVFYSGHGLPSEDGQKLYWLPQQADRDLIEETSIAQNKINAALQLTNPKSVTIFLDSCYAGVGRAGQSLIASARPISLKANTQKFPENFTVLTASSAEQISSSSNDLKHGIFSYYLMKGMEGKADSNKDGKITLGELHNYLYENVTRQASLSNRKQQPQLSGDANRVLVGR